MDNIPYMSKIGFQEYDYKNKKFLDNELVGGFVAFGIYYDEIQNGSGSYSTIILLMEDGKFKNIPVVNCRLIKEP